MSLDRESHFCYMLAEAERNVGKKDRQRKVERMVKRNRAENEDAGVREISVSRCVLAWRMRRMARMGVAHSARQLRTNAIGYHCACRPI